MSACEVCGVIAILWGTPFGHRTVYACSKEHLKIAWETETGHPVGAFYDPVATEDEP